LNAADGRCPMDNLQESSRSDSFWRTSRLPLVACRGDQLLTQYVVHVNNRSYREASVTCATQLGNTQGGDRMLFRADARSTAIAAGTPMSVPVPRNRPYADTQPDGADVRTTNDREYVADRCVVGVDFGTLSARAVLVRSATERNSPAPSPIAAPYSAAPTHLLVPSHL
jgi:hypothetical protein